MINKIANILNFSSNKVKRKEGGDNQSKQKQSQHKKNPKSKIPHGVREYSLEEIRECVTYLNAHKIYLDQRLSFLISSLSPNLIHVVDSNNHVIQSMTFESVYKLKEKLTHNKEDNKKGGLLDISC